MYTNTLVTLVALSPWRSSEEKHLAVDGDNHHSVSAGKTDSRTRPGDDLRPASLSQEHTGMEHTATQSCATSGEHPETMRVYALPPSTTTLLNQC